MTYKTYRNYKNLFKLIKKNINADLVIDRVSIRNQNNGCLISLSKETNHNDKIISVIIEFDQDDKLPNIKFILSELSENLKIKGSSFGEYDYNNFIKNLEDCSKIALRVLEEINIELAFD